MKGIRGHAFRMSEETACGRIMALSLNIKVMGIDAAR